MSLPILNQIRIGSITAATAVGAMIMHIIKIVMTRKIKSPNSPITIANLAANQQLSGGLFPTTGGYQGNIGIRQIGWTKSEFG